MPSHKFSTLILALCKPENQHNWNNDTWQEWVDGVVPLFSSEVASSSSYDANMLAAVRAFAHNFWAKSKADQLDYGHKNSDTDSQGRNLWDGWASKAWKMKKVNKEIDQILYDLGRLPYQLVSPGAPVLLYPQLLLGLIAFQFLTIAEAQLHVAHNAIADLFFGDDSYVDSATSHPRLKPHIQCFVEGVIVKSWNRLRKAHTQEQVKLKRLLKELEECWRSELTSLLRLENI